MYSLPELGRGCWRTVQMLAVLLRACTEAPRLMGADARTQSAWRRGLAKRMLRVMHVEVHQQGVPPTGGLLVSNHLGYLDVVVYGTIIEGTFLSKAEVARWPLIGLLTRAAGTLFVERDSARSTAVANRQIASLLQRGEQVLMFPEGTSSGGKTVLPFQSPFFDAPQRTGAPVWTASVAYRAELPHGSVAERICYWGDMVIGPHLFGLLTVRHIDATVCFQSDAIAVTDRRKGALEAHEAVSRIYETLGGTVRAER